MGPHQKLGWHETGSLQASPNPPSVYPTEIAMRSPNNPPAGDSKNTGSPLVLSRVLARGNGRGAEEKKVALKYLLSPFTVLVPLNPKGNGFPNRFSLETQRPTPTVRRSVGVVPTEFPFNFRSVGRRVSTWYVLRTNGQGNLLTYPSLIKF